MSRNLQREQPRTIPQLIDHHLSVCASPAVMLEKADGAWRAYSSWEIAGLVKRTALGLYALGVRPEDRIALLAENSPRWVIADYAIQSLGAVTVPIYTTQMPSQIEYILSDAGIRVCIVSGGALLERYGSMLEGQALDHLVVMAPENAGSKFRVLNEVRARGDELTAAHPALFDTLRSRVTEESAASIIYTSGTTGEPKGVVLTHGNLVSNAWSAASVLSWTGDDRALSFLPLSHIFERTVINMYLLCGVSVYFSESMERVPENLRLVRPTVFTTVPRLLEKLYAGICAQGETLSGVKKWVFNRALAFARRCDPEAPGHGKAMVRGPVYSRLVFRHWRDAFGGRLRYIISGGAPLAPQLARIYAAAGIPILQGYGLTETSPVIAVNRLEANRIGSVGRALPGVEIRVEPDGEICVRGPNVMRGLVGPPEETASVIVDGWFHTGDIGRVDAEGYLFITDRKKDLIKKSSGKAVAPAPIEQRLQESPFVEFAALAGEFRNYMSAMIFPSFAHLTRWADEHRVPYESHAELLRHPSVQALYQSVVDGVNERLNQWEYIAKFSLIDTELTVALGELTPTLKVRRRIITEKFRDRIDAMYACTG